MADWEFEETRINEIGDMVWAGPTGFGWAKVLVLLTGGPNDSTMNIEVEVPLTSRGADTISTVRRRVYEEALAGLRVAVLRLSELPSSPLDKARREPSA